MSIRHLACLTVVLVTLPALSPAAGGAPAYRCGTDLRAYYSPRALRHIRTSLQMRVLAERRRRIQLIAEMLARHASIDEFLRLPDDLATLAQGTPGPRMKHLPLSSATTCR